MPERMRLASPPSKPTLVFDGQCDFCRRWIERWRQITGEQVDYIAFQELNDRFPDLPREWCDEAVQLVETDGRVFSGAEAVFESLAKNPRRRWLLRGYRNIPGVVPVTDATYAFVARHRVFSSALTRLLWGKQVTRPNYVRVRSLFLRLIGIVYLCAFVSLWTQINGLIGSDGILPAEQTVAAWKQYFDQREIGFPRYFKEPSFCWIGASNVSIHVQCALGTVASLILIAGILPTFSAAVLWGLYLSLTTISGIFLGYQWDNLLLEAGFLTIFFAPLRWLPKRTPQRGVPAYQCVGTDVSRTALWLLRWLLFRLMFASGCVKLLSGDPTWRSLTALQYHYETQPLPTWLAWYAHQVPLWFHKFSAFGMFAVELAVPFLIFMPRRLRLVACIAFIGLELGIAATGNYTFFNLLTIALCVLLLDDAYLERLVPAKWRLRRLDGVSPHQTPAPIVPERKRRRWFSIATAAIAAVVVAITGVQIASMFRPSISWPPSVVSFYRAVAPFRSINSYGLFAVMTTNRPEIIVEGSVDGREWLAYEFKHKPGDLRERPGFVAPHQPRLDWQMWFAALGSYRDNPWFIEFSRRLLEGKAPVTSLLERNPFPATPPKYVRALKYDYHFTTRPERRAGSAPASGAGEETIERFPPGAWWKRQPAGLYCPVLTLQTNGTNVYLVHPRGL